MTEMGITSHNQDCFPYVADTSIEDLNAQTRRVRFGTVLLDQIIDMGMEGETIESPIEIIAPHLIALRIARTVRTQLQT